jgi:competence protein ComFC
MRNFSPIRNRAIEWTRRAGEALLSLCYPPHCAACERDTPAGCHLCAECALQARPIRAPFCRRCSQPFHGAITDEFTCSNCHGQKLHFESAVSPYHATGVVRDFVHRFKYNREFHLRSQLGDWMAAGLDDDRLNAAPFDGLTPVPLHPAKFREREFNQAAVLAGIIASRTRQPVLDCLQRTRYTGSQTLLHRKERMENLRGAFSLRHAYTVTGRHLLLIDDIFTTGSTADECSRVLRAAGAASVRVLTVARA